MKSSCRCFLHYARWQYQNVLYGICTVKVGAGIVRSAIGLVNGELHFHVVEKVTFVLKKLTEINCFWMCLGIYYPTGKNSKYFNKTFNPFPKLNIL